MFDELSLIGFCKTLSNILLLFMFWTFNFTVEQLYFIKLHRVKLPTWICRHFASILLGLNIPTQTLHVHVVLSSFSDPDFFIKL